MLKIILSVAIALSAGSAIAGGFKTSAKTSSRSATYWFTGKAFQDSSANSQRREVERKAAAAERVQRRKNLAR